jgi:hypothetical protein
VRICLSCPDDIWWIFWFATWLYLADRIKLAGFNHKPFLHTTRQKELEYNSPAAQASRSNCSEMPSFNLRTQYI